ncbi:MAG TPA: Rne/Rng family ribonuclease [Rhodospirillales bacterium]|nr:Rne/Rng family ribonuclease [Rhodospirillales bacterium]
MNQALINVAPGETRVALMDGEHLVELAVMRAGGGGVVGDIYAGRIEKVVPAIQAAFVSIGLDRSGFLALAEAKPYGAAAGEGERITDYVSEGDEVLVQAQQDPFGDKGAKLTTRLTVAGRYLVYTPGQPNIRVSRRIGLEEERARLSALTGELAAEGEGFILRTGAAGAETAALERDVAYLRATWAEIEGKRSSAAPPVRLYREQVPLRRVLRDETRADLCRVVIDDAGALADARALCERLAPEAVDLLELHRGPLALFEAHGVEEQIESALAPRIDLAGGGSIVIEETAALTAIDVNTGGRAGGAGPEETARLTNLEAAVEIARQIRLRGIGGLLVIDFVSMRRPHHGTEVLDVFRAALPDDRVPLHVAGFTRFGLVEMTRERRHASLSQVLLEGCSACGAVGRGRSAETVALEALRQVLTEARARPGARMCLTAEPTVIEALRGAARAALAEVEERLGQVLDLDADGELGRGRFDVAVARVTCEGEAGNG